MNVIDYITITCNLKNVRLQITFDYMKNVIDYKLRLPHVCPVVTLIFDFENQQAACFCHCLPTYQG